MSTEDRRATGVSRVPFDALVEVGGELGPSFEAQALDLSEEGMHLRTAYLPEVGQPLTFRFDAGPGRQVTAAGEVTWKQELGKGGEFGVRFTSLDGESVAALGRILGLAGPGPTQAPGSRVRLHIDGLVSPMRARVKAAHGAEITAFSELGFLQVGKQLELEDAQTGNKRPASIDRVEVEIHPESRVPQLVVTLRYDDDEARARTDRATMVSSGEGAMSTEESEQAQMNATDGIEDEPHVDLEAPKPSPAASMSTGSGEDIDIGEESSKMRGAIARGAAKVGPAMEKMMGRAKVTLALLLAKRKRASSDDAIPQRRTTAPPPGGALHATGRKVVRSDPELDARTAGMEEAVLPKTKLVTKRRAVVAGAVGAAAVLMLVATKKPAPPAPLASAPPETAATTPVTPSNATPIPAPEPIPVTPATAAPATPPDPLSLSPAAADDKEAKAPVKKVRVAPFGNGPVAHGNVLRLKMDGAIEKIEGAQQPTGFTVVIPDHRSLEAAGPLAARDSRIASIRVSNDPNGAELSVAFKDGVPNYQVRARGDTLEIALAPIGSVADAKSTADNHTVHAKHNDAGGKPHGKHHKNGHSQKH